MNIDGKRIGVFHETGMVCIVEVLTDTSNDKWEELTLKNLGMVRSSLIVKDPDCGEVFTVGGTKGEGSAYKGWFLDEDSESAIRVLREKGLLKP